MAKPVPSAGSTRIKSQPEAEPDAFTVSGSLHFHRKEIMKSVTLRYKEGSSDKLYQATIEPEGSLFVVNFAFGRFGSTLNTGTKTNSPVPLPEAEKIFSKL